MPTFGSRAVVLPDGTRANRSRVRSHGHTDVTISTPFRIEIYGQEDQFTLYTPVRHRRSEETLQLMSCEVDVYYTPDYRAGFGTSGAMVAHIDYVAWVVAQAYAQLTETLTFSFNAPVATSNIAAASIDASYQNARSRATGGVCASVFLDGANYGSVAGFAPLDVLCSNDAVAVSTRSSASLEAIVWAHELGHLIGSEHTLQVYNAIMAPDITYSTLTFRPETLAVIAGTVPLLPCLTPVNATSTTVPKLFVPSDRTVWEIVFWSDYTAFGGISFLLALMVVTA